jgi:hypothetical protein
MTTTEKLARLNELRQANGKSPLKAWKSSGEKLDAAILAETPAETPAVEPEAQVQQPAEQPPAATDGPTEQTGEQPEQPSSDEPKSERGAIGRLVISLLVDTDDDYATIVGKVREAHPDAKTTARSIASIAADLRRDGVDVKSRRKAKKVPAAD